MFNFNNESIQGYCPNCRKKITNWTDTMINDNLLDLYFSCDCGVHGCETYELTHRVTWTDAIAE